MKTLKFTILLMLTGSFASCGEDNTVKTEIDSIVKAPIDTIGSAVTDIIPGGIAGTVIGVSGESPYIAFLVQVEEEVLIGETIKYVEDHPCVRLLKTGTYRNVIQVQYRLPLPDWPQMIIGKKISFLYRAYQPEEDAALFCTGGIIHGPPSQCTTTIPVYIITDIRIFK